MDLENIDFDNLIDYLKNAHTSYLSESLSLYFFNLSLGELKDTSYYSRQLSELVIVLCNFFNIKHKPIAHFIYANQLTETSIILCTETSIILCDVKMTKFKKAMESVLENDQFYNKNII